MPRLVPALLLVAVFLGGFAVAEEKSQGEALFEKHCTTCHLADRSLKKNKDKAGWEKSVKRMQRYASGLFDDAQAKTIIEHLTQIRGPKN